MRFFQVSGSEYMPIQKYELRYLTVFYDDLSQIVDYITMVLRNPDAAVELVNLIEPAIQGRSDCAESFEPYHTASERDLPYYAIYVNNYVIYYVVIDHQIMEVRRCLYKGRNRRKILDLNQ